jgi:chromosome segregation ATPase
MTDDNANTADLTINEKLDQVLTRLSALESQGGVSTRPLLDNLIKEMVTTRETLAAQLAEVARELKAVNSRLDIISIDLSKVRGELREHDTRLSELEGRPN